MHYSSYPAAGCTNDWAHRPELGERRMGGGVQYFHGPRPWNRAQRDVDFGVQPSMVAACVCIAFRKETHSICNGSASTGRIRLRSEVATPSGMGVVISYTLPRVLSLFAY